MTASVSAILIGYGGSVEEVVRAVDALTAQSRPPEQIICVDQSPDGRFDHALARQRPHVERLVMAENLGYPSACNRAAARANGEYLLFINPDARAEYDCVAQLAGALEGDTEAAIAGAQILLPDGRVNAGENTLHLSGLSWAGHYGEPREQGRPREAAVVSGAALLVRRGVFRALGGYTEGFFMYYDDVDLAWRAQLLGSRVLFVPGAAVEHDYEFYKGGYKWRYLERNRWWCLLTLLEVRTLLLLAPLLAAVEVVICLRARREGWLDEKVAAWRLLWHDRRSLLAHRRSIQSARVRSDADMLARMTVEVQSPFLASGAARAAAPLLRVYRRLVLSAARH